MKVVVVTFPGSNCDQDCYAAVEKVGGKAFVESIGILGTCIKEAPEFASRKRHKDEAGA